MLSKRRIERTLIFLRRKRALRSFDKIHVSAHSGEMKNILTVVQIIKDINCFGGLCGLNTIKRTDRIEIIISES